MSKIDLNEEELVKLKTLADYMFFDEYQNKCSFPQFEKCFGVLFQEDKISLENTFKEICGPRKKYITFPRLINAYLAYKKNKSKLSKDLQTYFKSLTEEIIKKEDAIIGLESEEEQGRIYNSNSCKNRGFISEVEIYQSKVEGDIKGIKLQYDDCHKAFLYDKKDNSITPKVKFELEELETDPQIMEQITADTEFMVRDSISHVIGTFTDKIEFLGFKLRSGKDYCVGTPKGKPFLFGIPGMQFHYLRIKIKDNGLTYFEPHYKATPRINDNINVKLEDITRDYLDKDELICEESLLDKMENEEDVNKYVTAAPIIADDIENVTEEKTVLKKGNKGFDAAVPKEEKSFTQQEPEKVRAVKKKKDDLTLEKILGKPEKEVIEEDTTKSLEAPIESGNQDLTKEDPQKFMRNKRNYKALMMKVNGAIKDQIEKEKQSKKDESAEAMENIEEIEEDFNNFKNQSVRKGRRRKKNKFNFDIKSSWRRLSDKLELFKTAKIIQTIGVVIRAMCAIEKDSEMGLEEKIELYKVLDANTNIINFLNQNKDKDDYELSEEDKQMLKEFGNIDDLNLDEINQRIEAIDNYSKRKLAKPVVKRLIKVYEKCVARKNQLLKEEEEKLREEMIRNNMDRKEVRRMQKEAINEREGAKEQKRKEIEETINNTGVLRAKKPGNTKLRSKRERMEDRIGKFTDYNKNNRKKAAARPNAEKTFMDQEFPSQSVKDFKDDLFPPEKKSLCPVDRYGDFIIPDDALPEDYEGWEKLGWQRPKELLKTNTYHVFEDDDDSETDPIEDDDIIQGSYLSNCYFLSAVAALCPYPDFIKKLFHTQVMQKNGAYGVYLLINGEWKLVVLDDYIPCLTKKKTSYSFCFSSSHGKELWVNLIEKAWAKVNGYYLHIGTGGQPHEVFQIITEAHSESMDTPTPVKSRGSGRTVDPVWEKLLRAQECGFIMTAGTNAEGEGEDLGLYPGHAYSIIKFWDLYKQTGKDIKLVNLRNPWGEGEWSGDWSDTSRKWTAQYKKIVGLEDALDNGEFFMSYDDFCKYFVIMGICHFRLDYFYSLRNIHNRKGGNAKKENVLLGPQITKVTVPANGTDCYFRVIQSNPRFKFWDKNYKTDALQYIMLLDKDFNYIISEANTNTFTCLRHTNLKKGTYYLVTDINYRYIQDIDDMEGYNVSAYASTQVELTGRLDKEVDPCEIVKKATAQMAASIIDGSLGEEEVDLTEHSFPTGSKVRAENVCSNKISMYKSKQYSHRSPYQVFTFKNTTRNDVGLTLKITPKGKKNFEFYCDKDCKKTDTEKDLIVPANKTETVMVMKYNNSSIFTPQVVENAKLLKQAPAKKPVYADEDEESDEQIIYDSESEDAVFDETPDPLDKKGRINQYYMETDDGYILGLENTSPVDYDMSLKSEGLTIQTPKKYKGKQNIPSFTLKKNSKMTFKTTIIDDYDGDIYFVFDSKK